MGEQVMKTAVIYLRVSTTQQARTDGDPEGLSIPVQREACRAKAESLNAVVVEEYIDAGESAKTAARPHLQRLLERLRTQRDVDYVIVHKVDRLARSMPDHVDITMTIKSSGALLISVAENVDETPSGKMLEGMMALMSEFYSRNLATEVLKGMVKKAQNGGTPHKVTIGYLNVREVTKGVEIRTVKVDPERGPMMQRAFELMDTNKYTLDTLLAELTRKGLMHQPTGNRPARPLSRSQLAKALRNPYYMGVVTYRGVQYPGRHEPLVDRKLFERVQNILDSHDMAKERVRRHHHYLKGTVFCGKCGSRLCFTRARGKSGGLYYYFFCNGGGKQKCSQPYTAADDLEDEVMDFWARFQVKPERVREIQAWVKGQLDGEQTRAERQRRTQRSRLTRLKEERHQLLQAHYAKAIPLDLLKSEQERIMREMSEAEEALAIGEFEFAHAERVLVRAAELAGRCGAAYRDAVGTVKRDYNQAFFEAIYVIDKKVTRATIREPIATIISPVVPTYSRATPDPLLSGAGSNKTSLVEGGGFEPP